MRDALHSRSVGGTRLTPCLPVNSPITLAIHGHTGKGILNLVCRLVEVLFDPRPYCQQQCHQAEAEEEQDGQGGTERGENGR